MAPEAIVGGGVGSQPVLGAWLTAIPCLVESPDVHGVGLEQLLDDVALEVVEVPAQVGASESHQVAHLIDEVHVETSLQYPCRDSQKVVRAARLLCRRR